MSKKQNDKYCFYQIFKKESNVKVEGIGDCSICKKDRYNWHCKNYIKINISIIEIGENE